MGNDLDLYVSNDGTIELIQKDFPQSVWLGVLCHLCGWCGSLYSIHLEIRSNQLDRITVCISWCCFIPWISLYYANRIFLAPKSAAHFWDTIGNLQYLWVNECHWLKKFRLLYKNYLQFADKNADGMEFLFRVSDICEWIWPIAIKLVALFTVCDYLLSTASVIYCRSIYGYIKSDRVLHSLNVVYVILEIIVKKINFHTELLVCRGIKRQCMAILPKWSQRHNIHAFAVFRCNMFASSGISWNV